MKIAANEIKSVTIRCRSPLLVNITYKTGGSDSFNQPQMRELTDGAYNKVMAAVLRHDQRVGA